jgi:hypothetical protein
MPRSETALRAARAVLARVLLRIESEALTDHQAHALLAEEIERIDVVLAQGGGFPPPPLRAVELAELYGQRWVADGALWRLERMEGSIDVIDWTVGHADVPGVEFGERPQHARFGGWPAVVRCLEQMGYTHDWITPEEEYRCQPSQLAVAFREAGGSALVLAEAMAARSWCRRNGQVIIMVEGGRSISTARRALRNPHLRKAVGDICGPCGIVVEAMPARVQVPRLGPGALT